MNRIKEWLNKSATGSTSESLIVVATILVMSILASLLVISVIG